MTTQLLARGGMASMDHDGPVGSLMYDLMGEHRIALTAMGLALLGALFFIRFGKGRLLGAFRQSPLRLRAVALLLLLDGAAHVGLVLTAPGLWKLAFLGWAALTLVVITRMLRGKTWRRWAGLLLGGALVGYWVELLLGHPVDQVGLTVKVLELLTLGLVLEPIKIKRKSLRRALATTALGAAVLLNTTFAWAGAFGGMNEGEISVVDHHAGAMVTPGMVMLPHNDDEATEEERAEADRLWQEITIALVTYSDVEAARAAGYQVDGIAGDDFHAGNPAYQNDGVELDPSMPENLIYSMGPNGPVLMGAMFETEGLRSEPPTAGGPLLDWHRHEQVCFSILPFGLAGLVDPQGMCPVGSLAVTTTNSMMHVWTVPGAPQRFGDLDPVWKQTYLDNLGG